MPNAIDIANYFINLDTEMTVFDRALVEIDDMVYYAGNLRINKYLHMAQNIFVSLTGGRLFEDDMVARETGAISLAVQDRYVLLLHEKAVPELAPEICSFLNWLYQLLRDVSLDDLIELSRQDPEWVAKIRVKSKKKRQMDPMAHADEYKWQYFRILQTLSSSRTKPSEE